MPDKHNSQTQFSDEQTRGMSERTVRNSLERCSENDPASRFCEEGMVESPTKGKFSSSGSY